VRDSSDSQARTHYFLPVTFWVRTAEVLPEKLASPLYAAVMECFPALSDVENDALPLLRAMLPSSVEPSLN